MYKRQDANSNEKRLKEEKEELIDIDSKYYETEKKSNDDLDLPYILFYPSGETTGAKFTFSNNNQKYNFVLTHGGEFLRIDEF